MVLTMHNEFVKSPELRAQPDRQIGMTTLVYYYYLDKQYNNLFQLLHESKNIEFLNVRLFAQIEINRFDLAEKTLKEMQGVEEDNCLVTLSSCWLSLHNPKSPISVHEKVIGQLNELSEKFGYTLKTYNILATALMERGDFEKASQIYETALNEQGVYTLFEQ